MKKLFFVTLLLTVIVGIVLFVVPCEESIVEEVSSYSGSQVADDKNYDPYFQDSDDPELEPVKVYHKYKEEGITSVAKVLECNGNCNGKSYN